MRQLILSLGLLLLVGCTVPVQHGLDEPTANEVVTALERSGVGAEKAPDETEGGSAGPAGPRFVVKVARGDVPRALDLMRSLGLPRNRHQGFAEVYGQPSLVPTATEERARYLQALSSELERTLETIDGVTGARVHVVLAELDPFAADGKPRVPAQAAVLLRTRPGAPPLKEAEIQKLVAGSVPNLAPAAVAVVVSPAPAAEASASPLAALGPLRVSAGTRTALVLALAGGLALVSLLAVGLLLVSRRLAALQRELAQRNL